MTPKAKPSARKASLLPRERKVVTETKEKLFAARNLVNGIQLIAKSKDDCDEWFVLEAAAAAAVEKLEEVLEGELLYPRPTEKQMARAHEYMVQTGAINFGGQARDRKQPA